MSTVSYVLTDSMTMLRRQLKHMGRYASLTLMLVGMPVVFLLLFVYVFGGTLGDGLGQVAGGREAYLAYVVPGILMMAVAASAQGTSIKVAMDMTEGIIDRFKTMSIARVSVLTGHVLASLIQIVLAIAVTLGVAVAIGYRPEANPAEWLGLLGVVAMVGFAITWLVVAAGVTAKSPETASNTPMPLLLLPFLGSAFVPTESMPSGLRWFAEYQPFTPWIEVSRSLLDGTGIEAGDMALAVAWAVAIAALGYTIARLKFNKAELRPASSAESAEQNPTPGNRGRAAYAARPSGFAAREGPGRAAFVGCRTPHRRRSPARGQFLRTLLVHDLTSIQMANVINFRNASFRWHGS
ncbi:hypothetical protein GCM10029992_01540 [Glycomyces albus]